MGLLPDTQICGCACAGNAGNVFPVTAGKRSRHASRHVRHARAVMHVGIANQWFPLKSAAGENVPGIPGACATCNFTYLVRGPLYTLTHRGLETHIWVSKINHHSFRQWIVALFDTQSNICIDPGFLPKWTPDDISMWTFCSYTKIFVIQNAFKNVYKMTIISPGPTKNTT